MKKFNFTVTFFLYSLIVYIFYLTVFVFIKKSGYESGIYYFTPSYIFIFIKLFESGIKKFFHISVFITIPFLISLYLTLSEHPAGWEVSGFIPVMALMSYLFKSSDAEKTPLKNKYLKKIVWLYLSSVIFFVLIQFIKTKSVEEALYLAVSIYSPAPIAVTTAVFINFIISTAAISVILNNLKFFNNGTQIKRIIFNSDSFLTLPHLNLSGIETVKELTVKEFLELVEKLNREASENPKYSENLKTDKLFSKTFEDGIKLTMAPLNVMISKGNFSAEGLSLPQKNDDRSFVSLAKDNKIIGYYAIDVISPSTNATYLELIEKQYAIKSLIINPAKPDMWKECCQIKNSFEEIEICNEDIIISEQETGTSSGIETIWGGTDFSRGDIFVAKPFVTTIHNLIILSKNISNKIIKGTIFCSFPFSFPLFSISFGLKIPQISAVAVMFSFVFTIIFVFYAKSSIKENRRKNV